VRHPAVDDFVAWAARVDWISDVLLAGSLATGDHHPGTSDIDLVALTTEDLGPDEVGTLSEVHRRIDTTSGRGADLGCTYASADRVDEPDVAWPTWTHGRLVRRPLSAMARAELLDHGVALLGREPRDVLAPMSPDDVRAAVRAELAGYWTWAARRPWLFLDPALADLALLSMARSRHTWRTGELVTKSEALVEVRAPQAVVAGVRSRRDGRAARWPAPRLAHHAWHDVRRTRRDVLAGGR
jgi:hypothetical protein